MPCALIGGFAVSARAEPRATRDVDVDVSADGDGLELVRSTLSEWHIMLAALAAPLIEAMKTDAFQ